MPALFCAFLGAVHAQDRTLLAALEDGATEALGPGPWDQLVHGAILERSQVVPCQLVSLAQTKADSRPTDCLATAGAVPALLAHLTAGSAAPDPQPACPLPRAAASGAGSSGQPA